MKKKILALILSTILLVAVLIGCRSDTEDENSEEDYIPISVETVGNRDISEKTTFSGQITANKEVSIMPKMPGKVVDLNVEVGSSVKVGQVLFSQDKKDLKNQADQAFKSLELAKAGYQTTLDQIGQAGKQVELAEAGYRSTKEQIAQASKSVDIAQANYDKAKEQIDNAKINLERTKKLYEAGIVSKSEYEQAELAASDKNLDILKAQVDQAKLAVTNTPLDTARIQIEQARLGATDSGLNASQLQIEQAELAYNQALDAVEDSNVTSPTDGVVSVVSINEGEMASNAQPSIVIIDTSKMYVEVDVPENIVNKISVGQKVDMDISSINDSAKGEIEIISPAPDERTMLYRVRVLMTEVPEDIKSGMFVKANLETDIKQDVMAVKTQSIIEDGIKNYVYIVRKNKAVRKEVEIGVDSGEYIEILTGLNGGEKVLFKGQDYVEDGTTVKVIRGEK